MAEVQPRSFDLKSWQGLTDVLKAARESSLDPAEYHEFRNLVLQYAQLKGSDAELKKHIDAYIARLSHQSAEVANTHPEIAETREEEQNVPVTVPSVHGRRVVPSFAHTYTTDSNEQNSITIEPQAVESPEPVPTKAVTEEEKTPLPPEMPETQVGQAVHAEMPLKSIEEHKARILDIKRRVNALVGNPATLIDHGNHIGREYMTTLLTALKATSPGSTQNVEEAMERLEAAFTKILELGSGARAGVVPDSKEASEAHPVETETEPAENTSHDMGSDATEPVAEESAAAPAVVPEVVNVSIEERAPAEMLEEIHSTSIQADVRKEGPQDDTAEETPAPQDSRWSEEGGDPDMKAQIKALREELNKREQEHARTPTERPIIPSIIDIEEASPESQIESPIAHEGQSSEDPTPGSDELSTHSLTHRSLSSMTGITLGTPQAELMTPEVTGVLTGILHDWSIFASSGIFGMGPSGIDHPLYTKLARLPMAEVLGGRFENADMKVVRNIKDYVNAWRHEQGIAYNQTETFEHYLRRVAQRILKRQSGGKAV